MQSCLVGKGNSVIAKYLKLSIMLTGVSAIYDQNIFFIYCVIQNIVSLVHFKLRKSIFNKKNLYLILSTIIVIPFKCTRRIFSMENILVYVHHKIFI